MPDVRVAPERRSLLAIGPLSRRVRLASGLVLFAYVGLHLIDHSLGNAGIAAMNAMLLAQKVIWQSVVGTTLLYGALLTHAGLGLWSLYARRYVGWTRLEVAQLVLGLSIPVMLANHFTVTRLTLTLFAHDKTYAQELHALWLAAPAWGVLQLGVLLVAWTHACIGLGRAARLAPWFPRWRPMLLAGAVLLPVLAMLGFAQGVREQARAEAAPGWRPDRARVEAPAEAAVLRTVRNDFLLAYLAAILAILAARAARTRHETGRRGIAVRYPDGRLARIPAGMSVLDASRMAGVRHASVCGGRGRCSTCRVRVRAAPDHLPAPSGGELRVLQWVGLDPARIRLACQLRPLGDLCVAPLVPPEAAEAYVAGRAQPRSGEERFVAAMFVDMRDSTRLAESQLPYDSMFLVGRFVAEVARAVIEAGGVPNQFTGDGVFALFGLDRDPQAACRAALDAVSRIGAALAAVNAGAPESGPVRAGIGLHCGAAIVGEIGFGRHVTTTALGDVVNTAARLQAMTRELGCDSIVSEAVFAAAATQCTPGQARLIGLRGRTAPLPARLLGGRTAGVEAPQVGRPEPV